MVTMKRQVTWCVGALLVLLVLDGGAVSARGNGIKAGPGRLHVGLNLDFVFDSNPGYLPSGEVMDLMLKIRPGLLLSFPSDTVEFELSSQVGYDYFFGVEKSVTSNLSTFAGEADLRLGLNPKGAFSVFIEDNFSRTADPRYSALSGKFDRTDNEAKLRMQIKPGGGALMFDLAYGFFIDWFDQQANYDAEALSSYAHRAYFSAKWKFLPKTAVTLDFDSDIRRYPNSYDAGFKNADINAIRATIGLLGQITPAIALAIRAGYGDSLSGSGYQGSDYRSAIGQAELSYRSGTTFFQLGYVRNFQPVVLFAWFGQDRAYARFRQQLAGRFVISADVSYDYLSYGQAVDPNSVPGDRSDHVVSAGASFDVHFLDWIELGLSYQLQARFSDWAQPQNAIPVDYTKHMIMLHAALDY
ncbi:MAG: hypothetical protein D6806_09040 [Deltaproteobacteria bacterium]|nr:MAG: hypothetical protein D6806_09040 [Deltaproteobacteria bacterium]